MSYSSILSRPGGTMTLHPVQEAALAAAHQAGGLLGHLGVGAGKTLLAALLPSVLPCERPVVAVPAQKLARQAERMWWTYSQHWYLRARQLTTYWALSNRPGLLAELSPDLLILDEAHQAALISAACTRRIRGYLSREPGCRVVALSGTLLDHRISRWFRLARWVLGDSSPAPRYHADAVELERVLAGEGAAREQIRWSRQVLGYEPGQWGESWRAAVESTPGVIVDRRLSCDASLLWVWESLPPSPRIAAALDALDKAWELPGRVWADAPAVSQARAMLQWGVYLQWVDAPDPDWLRARRVWSSAIRQYVKRAPEGRDTELLIRRVCEAGHPPTPYLREAWGVWQPHTDTPPPPMQPRWVDHEPLRYVQEWLDTQPPTLVWCAYTAIAERLAELGIERAPLGQVPEYHGQHLVVATRSHGTGCELQDWSHNAVLSWPPSARACEQLIGRTHRQGQLADEVHITAFTHDHENVERAHAEALTAQSVLGPQRLVLARPLED